MKRLPWWTLWPLAALGPVLVVAVLRFLPFRYTVQAPGAGVLWVRWNVLCPVIAAAFGLPLFAARVVVKACRWWALGAGTAALLAVGIEARLWPVGRGGGAMLAWIAMASALVGMGAALLAGEKLLGALEP